MRLWIELSGEHPTLPRAEALAAMEAERVEIREASWSSGLFRLEAVGPVERAASRLGLAHAVCAELAHGSFKEVRADARSLDLGGKSFRIRARGLGVDVDKRELEGALGADLGRTGRVDLTNPNVDLRLIVGTEFLLGRVVHRVDRSGQEARKVTHRPFSLPISLHPKYCRALLNLSRVPTGGTVADPFCGTGGILLEASRMGLRALGADLRRAMVTGARRSLRSLGADADYLVADAGHPAWRPGTLGGVATDPPYGRAASTRGEAPLELYRRAFAAIDEVLPRKRYAAAVLPNDEAVAAGMDRMELVERHDLRVHKSLTRIFCAFLT